jgi:hypothetical protein
VVDVSGLVLNQSIQVKDLAMPEGVTPDVDEKLVVANVTIPRGGLQDGGDEAPVEGSVTDVEVTTAKDRPDDA